MTEYHIFAHARAPQVEVAILEAQRLVNLNAIANWERRCTRGIQYLDMLSGYFDSSSRQVWVFRSSQASHHSSANLYNVLRTHLRSNAMGLRRAFWITNDLCNTIAITYIQEDKPSMITPPVHPASQGYVLSNGIFI